MPYRLSTAGSRALPTFLVIGAQKCGTTSLYKYLVRHPRARPALKKEVWFFDLYYDKGVPWYRAHFPRVPHHGADRPPITGEASPGYLPHPLAPGRARAVLPSARLIAILRDPVERAWSHYHHARKRGWEHLPFTEAIELELRRLAGEPSGERDHGFEDPTFRFRQYVAWGHYADHLAAWLEHFPRAQLLVLTLEELAADPPRAYQAALRHVGLHEHSLADYRAYVPGSYSQPIPDDARRRLREHFLPHDRKLAALLGSEVPWK